MKNPLATEVEIRELQKRCRNDDGWMREPFGHLSNALDAVLILLRVMRALAVREYLETGNRELSTDRWFDWSDAAWAALAQAVVDYQEWERG